MGRHGSDFFFPSVTQLVNIVFFDIDRWARKPEEWLKRNDINALSFTRTPGRHGILPRVIYIKRSNTEPAVIVSALLAEILQAR